MEKGESIPLPLKFIVLNKEKNVWGYLFARGDFSWEVGGTFPQNSFKHSHNHNKNHIISQVSQNTDSQTDRHEDTKYFYKRILIIFSTLLLITPWYRERKRKKLSFCRQRKISTSSTTNINVENTIKISSNSVSGWIF